METKTGRTFTRTRSLRASNLTQQKSAEISVLPDGSKSLKEAINIRKEGQQAMNRDECSYQPSHAYDRFLDSQEPEELSTSFF